MISQLFDLLDPSKSPRMSLNELNSMKSSQEGRHSFSLVPVLIGAIAPEIFSFLMQSKDEKPKIPRTNCGFLRPREYCVWPRWYTLVLVAVVCILYLLWLLSS